MVKITEFKREVIFLVKKPISDVSFVTPAGQQLNGNFQPFSEDTRVMFKLSNPLCNWTFSVKEKELSKANEQGEWKVSSFQTLVVELMPKVSVLVRFLDSG